MADIVPPDVRSRMMSGILGKNTKPEWAVRRALHAHGFRYRLHVRDLPGHPDIVLRRHRAVVFIHGCFWHGHDCSFFRWPKTRPEFWQAKIERNRANDAKHKAELQSAGWRVAVVWECALRRRMDVGAALAEWIKSDTVTYEIRG